MTTTSQADVNTNTNAFNTGIGSSGSSSGIDNNASRVVGGPTANVVNKNLNITSNCNSKGNSANNVSGSSSNNQRAPADITGKRKKLKSRNAAVSSSGYAKDHLDAWLETCLKDASNTQLSSSSEFLDYNPTSAATTNIALNKNIFAQQQQQMSSQSQQQQQQQQQQQHQPALQQTYLASNMHNFSHPQQQQQQQQQQQHQQQQQQQFALRTNTQPPVSYSSGYNAPFSQGFQRSIPNFMKHSNHNSFNNRFSALFPSGNNFYPHNDGSQDFASLPPIVNMLGLSSEHENNSTDVLDGSGSNPNICRGFRFSDPCLLNPSDNDSKMSGQNTPDRRNYVPNEMENNKFFTALMEQINLLHETNSKICRNLHETKVDIEALKHAPNWGMRHRRDSLSGLSTHSQPMVFGGGFGTHSPAPTYHSGAYTPGMMTDVVREVKEAARVREDALLNRVKAMVEERQWSMNESNLRMMRDIEELKSQIHHLRVDRKETNKRITHLEAENKYMRQMLATVYNSRNNAPNIIYENEALRSARKNFPHTRRTHSLNLHYGTIHHQPAASSQLVEEQDEPLHIIETNSSNSVGEGASVNTPGPLELRNSFSSSDGGASIGAANPLLNGSDTSMGHMLSPPNFALVSLPAEDIKSNKTEKQTKKITDDARKVNESPKVATHELQRELIEAVAARKEADDRIIALEKLVKNLQVNATTHPAATPLITNGDGNIVGGGVYNTSTISTLASASTAPNSFNWHQPPTLVTNMKHHQAHTTASTSVSMSHLPPKLSVAGPVTDL